MQQQPVRVFVVDDHAVVRRGLRAYLEMVDDMEVVDEAADGQEALDGIAALVVAGRSPEVAKLCAADRCVPGGLSGSFVRGALHLMAVLGTELTSGAPLGREPPVKTAAARCPTFG